LLVVGLGKHVVLSTHATFKPLPLQTVAVLTTPLHSPEPGLLGRVGRGRRVVGKHVVLSIHATFKPLPLQTVVVLTTPVHSPESGKLGRVGIGGCLVIMVPLGRVVVGTAVGVESAGSTEAQSQL
jgi:hypothetical protein